MSDMVSDEVLNGQEPLASTKEAVQEPESAADEQAQDALQNPEDGTPDSSTQDQSTAQGMTIQENAAYDTAAENAENPEARDDTNSRLLPSTQSQNDVGEISKRINDEAKNIQDQVEAAFLEGEDADKAIHSDDSEKKEGASPDEDEEALHSTDNLDKSTNGNQADVGNEYSDPPVDGHETNESAPSIEEGLNAMETREENTGDQAIIHGDIGDNVVALDDGDRMQDQVDNATRDQSDAMLPGMPVNEFADGMQEELQHNNEGSQHQPSNGEDETDGSSLLAAMQASVNPNAQDIDPQSKAQEAEPLLEALTVNNNHEADTFSYPCPDLPQSHDQAPNEAVEEIPSTNHHGLLSPDIASNKLQETSEDPDDSELLKTSQSLEFPHPKPEQDFPRTTRHPASARISRCQIGPITLPNRAAGSGAMAVRGRLAAATSREAVLRQEAEMAAADLDIMSEEKAELEARLEQEIILRKGVEEELQRVLDDLEVERASPYKEMFQAAEAKLKVSLAQIASMEKQLKELQVDSARDRAVAEVAERKREDSERRREAAEQRAYTAENSAALAASQRDYAQGSPLGNFRSIPRRPHDYTHQHMDTTLDDNRYSMHNRNLPFPDNNHQARRDQDAEILELKGALEQAQRTNNALLNAELRRNGVMEDPQEATERRLRMLENAFMSPFGYASRQPRMIPGGVGAAGWMGGASWDTTGIMFPTNPQMAGGGISMYQANAPPALMPPPASPSRRMHSALSSLDYQLGGGGYVQPGAGYAQMAQQQAYPAFQALQQQDGVSSHYGASPTTVSGMMMAQPSQMPQYRAMTVETGPLQSDSKPASMQGHSLSINHEAPAATRQERFEQSLRTSTADVYHQQPTNGRQSIHHTPMAHRKGTSPNNMDEDVLRAARIDYHQEKKRIMDMQMQRQRIAEA